jgi:hypothetical protein
MQESTPGHRKPKPQSDPVHTESQNLQQQHSSMQNKWWKSNWWQRSSQTGRTRSCGMKNNIKILPINKDQQNCYTLFYGWFTGFQLLTTWFYQILWQYSGTHWSGSSLRCFITYNIQITRSQTFCHKVFLAFSMFYRTNILTS